VVSAREKNTSDSVHAHAITPWLVRKRGKPTKNNTTRGKYDILGAIGDELKNGGVRGVNSAKSTS